MITLLFECIIKKGTSCDRAFLNSLAKNPLMGNDAPLVYIYALGSTEPSIPYPKAIGRTIYIGETQRKSGSWRRFPAHFSGSLTGGVSTQINHTLSIYYHAGVALHLRIFKVNDGHATTEAERVLLRSHLHTFGAYPLGQGGTGKSNTPSEVSRLFIAQKELHISCAELFGCGV
ncbi:hypothetical protein [Pseudomonas frederiksbergensis]|uniref:GIY-YIG domain-containing protein n=1 Tax=Pseudomonas frederiksbergensis TaxID=104087 RepID=A0A6L5BV58_9PSED|nr:hypothetical protein [Pseudomonas frederiksbergensis]KAF2391712.1 hypothetical protein FX983_06197 [Pseudomonas frederiksbergensis]